MQVSCNRFIIDVTSLIELREKKVFTGGSYEKKSSKKRTQCQRNV